MLRQADCPFEGMNRVPGELRKEHWPCPVLAALLAQQGRSEREGLSVQGTEQAVVKWYLTNGMFSIDYFK